VLTPVYGMLRLEEHRCRRKTLVALSSCSVLSGLREAHDELTRDETRLLSRANSSRKEKRHEIDLVALLLTGR
jgi:hypothetical protein